MPEFSEKSKLSSLSQTQRDQAVRTTNRRWKNTTDRIRPLIDESETAWDFVLRNQPREVDMPETNRDASAKGASKGFRLGLIPRSVDAVTSRIKNAMFPADERFFRGVPKNDVSNEYQEHYELYATRNFAKENVTTSYGDMIFNMAVDPTVCVAFPWKTKTRRKVEWKPKTLEFNFPGIVEIEVPLAPLGLEKKVNENHIEWEGTSVEVLDFCDWRVDPDAKTFDDSWFIRRWYEPVWKVKKDYKLKEVQTYHKTVDEYAEQYEENKENMLGFMPIDKVEEESGREQALLMIHYDDFVLDGEVFENHVALILNGDELVWFDKNPYDHGQKPYGLTSYKKIPNQLYGMSMIRHAVASAAIADTAMSKALKSASFGADPIFEVDVNEPALRKTKKIVAGMKIPVKRKGAISQVNINLQPLTYLMEMVNQAQQNIREITGASQVFTGDNLGNSPANITAFHVGQHIQGADSRFKDVMKCLENGIIERHLFQSFENDKQYKKNNEFINIGGEEKELTTDIIKQMDFEWVITSSQAAAQRGQELANKVELLKMAPNLAQAGILQYDQGGSKLDTHALLMAIARDSGTTDVETFLQRGEAPQGESDGLPGLQQAGPGPAGPADSLPL